MLYLYLLSAVRLAVSRFLGPSVFQILNCRANLSYTWGAGVYIKVRFRRWWICWFFWIWPIKDFFIVLHPSSSLLPFCCYHFPMFVFHWHAVNGVVAAKPFSDLVDCTEFPFLFCFFCFASQFLDEVPLVLTCTPFHFSVSVLILLLCPFNLP